MRRIAKWIAIGVIVIFVPFGALIMLIPLAVHRIIARVDVSWQPTPAVISWARFWCFSYRVPFNFALSILYNEGASEPRALNARELQALDIRPSDLVATIGYPVGDIGDGRGPAIGPGQVLRVNIERLWQDVPWYMRDFVISRHESDLALLGNESKALWVAVRMMREVIDQSADGDLWEAAKRYNGGAGSDPRAIAYADKSKNTLDRIA